MNSPYPAAPWTLLSLLRTLGGASAQQKGENNHGLLWFAAKEREVWGGSQQREARAHRSGADLSPWRPSELQNAGSGLQAVLQNYFISLSPHLCLALGDKMGDWANEEAETFWFKDVLSELFIIIHSLVGFSAFEFYEDCGFSFFYIILLNVLQKLSHLLLHAPKPQLRVTVFDRFREKCPQYFLFLRKNIFKKINVSLMYACVCIYNANFPPGLLIHV